MANWLSFDNRSDADQIPSQLEFEHWVRLAMQITDNKENELSISVVGTTEIQTLNRQYRDKDQPTNVLSFPFAPVLPEQASLSWGDIVICASVVEQEATMHNKPLQAHWAHLTLHGTLHLLGYDHVKEKDAQQMEALEITMLNQLGFANPYEVGVNNV